MTLMGGTANQYAPGESGVPPALGQPQYQNVNFLGRYNLQGLTSPNVLIGIAGVVVVLWLTRRYLGGKRR